MYSKKYGKNTYITVYILTKIYGSQLLTMETSPQYGIFIDPPGSYVPSCRLL